MELEEAVNKVWESALEENLPVDDRRFFVEQGDEEGEYEVRKFHNENASESGFESKQEAVEAARDMAREASGPETKAQVKVRDGGSFSRVDGKKVVPHNFYMDRTLQELAGTVKNSEYRELFPETDLQKVKKNEDKVKEALFQVHHMIYDDELNEILDDELSYNVPVSEVKEVLTGDDVDRFEKLVPEDKKVISKDRLKEMTSTNAGR